MEQTKVLLKAREKQLIKIITDKKKVLKKAPDGSLRICCRGSRTLYYRRTDPKDFNGVYIRQKDKDIAYQLAQKEYDKKVLHAAEKELTAIQKYLAQDSAMKAEEIYDSLHKERQKLIVPITETEEDFTRKWEEVPYQGKEFYQNTSEFYTAKGERVRSKSEWIIADLLYKEGIPYRYEYPIAFKGVGEIYPDFTVLNIGDRKENIGNS
ncbi:MAG: hypothetical protein ACOYBL_08440 [Lachnospiraceae bacterium]|jgi:hypothetical protein